jgi:hypothetical protein
MAEKIYELFGYAPCQEMPAASRISLPVIAATDRGMTTVWGKLNLWMAPWIGSISTAATTSKPGLFETEA